MNNSLEWISELLISELLNYNTFYINSLITLYNKLLTYSSPFNVESKILYSIRLSLYISMDPSYIICSGFFFP